jgi:hypothetical protein
VNCPGGMASRLGIDLTKVLQESQPRGISSHLHYCWAFCKKVIVKTNDHSAERRWSAFAIGSGINELDAPTTPSVERSATGNRTRVSKRLRKRTGGADLRYGLVTPTGD